LTYQSKYRLSQSSFIVCFAGAVFSLLMLAANGRDSTSQAKFWSVALLVFVVIGLPLCIAYYYYHSHQLDTKTQQQIAVETLAKLGKQRRGKL